jgi:hypothetical protein
MSAGVRYSDCVHEMALQLLVAEPAVMADTLPETLLVGPQR